MKRRRWRRSLEKKKTREEISVRRRRRRRGGRRSIGVRALRGSGFHLFLLLFFSETVSRHVPNISGLCPGHIGLKKKKNMWTRVQPHPASHTSLTWVRLPFRHTYATQIFTNPSPLMLKR